MSSSQAAEDRKFMRHALTLARQAWGKTAPNPMVGAVVVKDGVIVGEGYHHKAGTPHAEVHALNAAGKAAEGSTIYVTLPSSDSREFSEKRSKIKRVVCAGEDFNPKHAGNGFDILRSANIEVKVGVCRKEAMELNKAFFSYITRKRPYVLLKMAMTLDGKIATACGDSKWITSAAARNRVQQLRQWCDAIMVGGETVRLDRPGLIVRNPENWENQPQKLIYTRMSDALLRSEYFPDDPAVRAVAPANRAEWLELLTSLSENNVTALLLEGGGELSGNALQCGIVDEVEFHVAPKLLTGRNSRSVVAGADPVKLAEAINLEKLQVKRAGCDLIISGKVKFED